MSSRRGIRLVCVPRHRGSVRAANRRTHEVTAVLDLEPPARQLITLAEAVTNEVLPAPTPCGDYTVRNLLAHVMGLSIAFRDAAAKAGTPAQDAVPSHAALDDAWRDQPSRPAAAMGCGSAR